MSVIDDDRWAENLPQNCPPADAVTPNNEIYYRLVDDTPPQESDFYSARIISPQRKIHDECIARAISLYRTSNSCEKAKKVPFLKNKKVIGFSLPPTSGLVKQTGGNDHWSWWRLKNFDIVSHIGNGI